jgi:hypothetical protein
MLLTGLAGAGWEPLAGAPAGDSAPRGSMRLQLLIRSVVRSQ